MSAPSLNSYVVPLAVAWIHGFGVELANGGRELRVLLSPEARLKIVATRSRDGWWACVTLRTAHGELVEFNSTPTTTAIQAEAVALAKLDERHHMGVTLAKQLRQATVARHGTQEGTGDIAADRVDGTAVGPEHEG